MMDRRQLPDLVPVGMFLAGKIVYEHYYSERAKEDRLRRDYEHVKAYVRCGLTVDRALAYYLHQTGQCRYIDENERMSVHEFYRMFLLQTSLLDKTFVNKEIYSTDRDYNIEEY